MYLKVNKSTSFFQAVWVLLKSDSNAVLPGNAGPVSRETILFKSNASLAFPVREVERIEFDEKNCDDLPGISMTVNFLGLYGPSSPLPDHYTEEILFNGTIDSNTRLFLDIFNHRYISFLYRCWEKYRYPLQYQPGATDKMSQWLLSLIGLHRQELREQSNLDWQRLMPIIGLLSMHSGSAWILKQVISIYFRVENVSIEQNIETEIDIDQEQLNTLGVNNTRLGSDISLGKTIKDCSSKFRVCIGPLKLTDYKSFLPNGENYTALQELVLLTIGDPLQFEIRLILTTEELPVCIISSNNFSNNYILKNKKLGIKNVQLGMTTWLGTKKDRVVNVLSG